ncbi:uncharacterized protein B0H64DRAFT_374707 [Chaetomium fimeti]|uniref:Uncharacterized protein n=1 Tax=Chaetomium fimeti TaxID=1854472 RepID=A0AAE0HDY5_9PEZI|nr:hypothetical protein B0H64DRAFT_374707 [Chaetomium fimeti]
MKFALSLFALYVAFASGASSPQDAHDGAPILIDRDGAFNVTAEGEEIEVDIGDELDLSTLEKRRGCSGHRRQNDVCKGNALFKMNSRHNCYRRGGHCCAKSKNGDYGIQVTSGTQSGEDCGYCFSGKCRAE